MNFLIESVPKNRRQKINIDIPSHTSDEYNYPNYTNQQVSLKYKIRRINKMDSVNPILNVYENFNWIHYLLLNQDLVEADIITHVKALEHWNNYGISENRRCVLTADELNDYLYLYMDFKNKIGNNFQDVNIEQLIYDKYSKEESDLFKKYPCLFHKYLLFLRNPTESIIYKIPRSEILTKPLICSIHCFDLNVFSDFFEMYLSKIREHFDIIVTYCIENINVIYNYNFTFIKIQNIGMDIGGKFACTKYLNDVNYHYSYIFFIHSKSDAAKRKQYIGPFTQNIKKIVEHLKNNEIGGYFSNKFLLGDISLNKIKNNVNFLKNASLDNISWKGNEKYYSEIKTYFGINNENYFFNEGNVYVINQKIAKKLFSNLYIFNVLNTLHSFDYNWFSINYRENDNIFKMDYNAEVNNILSSYKKFKERKLFGNNLSTGLGHSGLPDCMIEHVFERLTISCIMNENMLIKIINEQGKNALNYQILERYLNDGTVEKNKSTNLSIYNDMSMHHYYNEANFCPFTYLSLNPDLHVLHFEELKNHWKMYGFIERRKTSIKNFDYNFYINHNSDLKKNGIDTAPKAVHHWITNGINEGRIGSMCHLKKMYDEYLQTNYKKPRTFINNCNIVGRYFNHNDIYNSFSIPSPNKYNVPFFKDFQIIDTLDYFDNFLLVLDFPHWGGGCSMFLQNVIEMYGKTTNFLIVRNFNGVIYFYLNDIFMLRPTFNEKDAVNYMNELSFKISKVFINSIITHSFNFLESIFNMNKTVTCITHDYSLLFTDSTGCYSELALKQKSSLIDLSKVHHFITQNENNLDIYSKFIPHDRPITITDLPDFKNKLSLIESNNEKIIIGFLGNISEIKGYYMVSKLIELSKTDNTFEVIIFGRINMQYEKQYSYNSIEELNVLLMTHKPNIWIDGSIVPETYSFTLTLMMITELPIFYQAKTFNSVMENRLEQCYNKYEFDSIYTLLEDITILTSKRQDFFYTINNRIHFNEFWDHYFGKNIAHNKHDISSYCIYFPQFHSIPENNVNFYNGFTDCVNLNYVRSKLPEIPVETPNCKALNVIAPWQYNLETHSELIQKQIDIIEKYGVNGFAIYYYWFSTNTITGKNMIMEKVINKFFDETINMKDRKVFFVWANEDWSKNASFGETNEKIENLYDCETILLNITNLIPYFKHHNYLKIDNKPVFLLHHPWFISPESIDYLKYVFEQTCLQNGFSGIHFILNSMDNVYPGHKHYDFNFNYKKDKSGSVYRNENGVMVMDYINYTNSVSCDNNHIKTVVFDFDNRVRLASPDKINLATVCFNNTGEQQLKFLKKTVDSYANSNSGIDKILLINAWNEWGEKMQMEPSNERGFYYLNLLNSVLKK